MRYPLLRNFKTNRSSQKLPDGRDSFLDTHNLGAATLDDFHESSTRLVSTDAFKSGHPFQHSGVAGGARCGCDATGLGNWQSRIIAQTRNLIPTHCVRLQRFQWKGANLFH